MLITNVRLDRRDVDVIRWGKRMIAVRRVFNCYGINVLEGD